MYRLLFLLASLFLPTQSLLASIYISEVAWMGSTESANYEWIELHNSGEGTSVEGWTLSDGANLTITLAGTIPTGTYAVLERNRSDSGSVVGTPLLNYSGALINTGATLTLRRADGSVVDSVSGGENWQNIGGDNVTKETAQYSTSGWITATPTPGRANATTGSTQTASVTSPGSSSANTSTSASIKTTTSKLTSSTKNFSIQIIAPNFIYAGQPVKFSSTASGVDSTIHKSVHHRWNFGDLNTSSEVKPTHTYIYPGTYSVVLNAGWNGQDASAQLEVTVLPVTVSLLYSLKGDVLLQNDAMYQVDVSGYYLQATKELQIPAYTLIPPRGTITIPWKMLGHLPSPPTFLRSREKEIVTSTYVTKPMEAEAFVPAVITPTISIQPTSQSQSSKMAGEEIPTPAPFGFVSSVAYESEEDEVSEDMKLTQAVVDETTEVSKTETGEASDAYGATPILTSSTTPKTTPTTWWTYILLALLLTAATSTLIYKPNKKLTPLD